MFLVSSPMIRSYREFSCLYVGEFLIFYWPQGILTLSFFSTGIESWAPRPDWAHLSYMMTYWLNGTTEWIYYGQRDAKDWLVLSFIAAFLVASVRRYFLDDRFSAYVFMSYASVGLLVILFFFSQWRSSWLSNYVMPAAANFLPLVVAVIYAYPRWIRWGLLTGILFLFVSGATPYSRPDLSVDKLANIIKQRNPDGRYGIFCYPSYLFIPIAYHYSTDILLSSVEETSSPFDKIKEVAAKHHLWLSDDYDGNRPWWLSEVDTVLVIVEDKNVDFVKHMRRDFEIKEPPIYAAPHQPMLFWACRHKTK